ncbi:VCBS domain-containing protein, partial [Synechococcus sp. CS-1330]|nr:VCBS domain-containing protein [Synechococcus sp. CS-1330]
GTLTLNENGSYTYVSNANEITGEETDTFVYTIADGDGDLSTTTLTITLTDSGLVATNDDITVNEAALATGSNPTSGAETATGTLVDNVTGGTPGYTYALTGSGDGSYGSLTLNIDGTYSYTLDTPFDTSPDANNGTNTEDNRDTFTYQATDANGNTVTNTITIDIIDDVPTAVVPSAITITNGPSGPVTELLDADSNVSNNYGADGAGTVRFSPNLDGTDSLLTSSFVPIIYDLSDDYLTLTGTTLVNGIKVTIFTITLDPVTSRYAVSMDGSIDSKVTIDFNNGAYNFTGGNNSWTGFVPVGEVLGSTSIDNNSLDLLLTPGINSANAGTVNTTATIGGISSGASVGPGETFRVDFVKDLRGDPADTVGGQNYASSQNRDHNFDGHYVANGASALFKSSNNSTVKITAFDDPDGDTIVGDGSIDAISGVTISYFGIAGSIIVPTSTATSYTVNGHVFTVTLNVDDSVSVAGVAGDPGSSLQGTVIAVFTANGYNSVEYTYQTGDTFQIGDFGATVKSTEPVNFTVPVEVIDGDGDISASSNLDITANPPPLVPPLVIDLTGDGFEYVSRQAGVSFDMNDDGYLDFTAWIGASDGFLAYDYNNDGRIAEAREFVFTMWGNDPDVATDMQALAAYFDADANSVKDGVLDANDTAWSYFGVWQDLNVDGIQDEGEFAYLADWEITGISLSYDGDTTTYAAADGDVLVYGQMAVTYADGSTGLAEDVAFAVAPVDAPVAGTTVPAFDTFIQDVAIPDEQVVVAEVASLDALVEQYVGENAVTDEAMAEYQQELALTEVPVTADMAADPAAIEPTADALVALDEVDALLSDDASDGIATVAVVVEDFSYSV